MARSSLLRTIDILEYVATEPEPVTASETARQTGASRATVYRTLEELVQQKWLVAYGSPRRYSPSFRVIELGLRPLRRLHVRDVVLPYLLRLATDLGHTVTLSFYDHGDVVCTDRVEVLGERVALHVSGNRVPAPAGAAGKILLAHQQPEEIERVVAQGLPRFTDATKTRPADIREDIRLTSERGYGLQDREYTQTSGGIACPVFDSTGAAVAAIAVGGRPSEEFVDLALEPTRTVALKASIELGYRPSSVVDVA